MGMLRGCSKVLLLLWLEQDLSQARTRVAIKTRQAKPHRKARIFITAFSLTHPIKPAAVAQSL